MKINVIVTQQGMKPEQFIKYIKFKNTRIRDGLIRLGEETRDYMRNVIKTNKKRAGSKNILEGAIKSYYILAKDQVNVGVGRISELDVLAPYWYLINYGGYSAPAKRGMKVPGYFGNFEPPSFGYKGTGAGWQKFTYAKDYFFMKPDSPIMAMNYIEKTKGWIRTMFAIKFQRWTRKSILKTK